MKKKHKKDKAVRITISLDPNLAILLRRLAKKNRRSISGTVSLALQPVLL